MKVAFFMLLMQGDTQELFLECLREVAMNNKQLRSFLESLDLTWHGFVIELVEFERPGPTFAHCGISGTRTQDKQPFALYVICDMYGQVTFSLNLFYEKGPMPDILSASLIELCNELNVKSLDCCAKLTFHPERSHSDFNVIVTMSFILPMVYYRRKIRDARDLYRRNLVHFLSDVEFLQGEMSYMLGQLSESGIFDSESVDADDVALPGEQ